MTNTIDGIADNSAIGCITRFLSQEKSLIPISISFSPNQSFIYFYALPRSNSFAALYFCQLCYISRSAIDQNTIRKKAYN